MLQIGGNDLSEFIFIFIWLWKNMCSTVDSRKGRLTSSGTDQCGDYANFFVLLQM